MSYEKELIENYRAIRKRLWMSSISVEPAIVASQDCSAGSPSIPSAEDRMAICALSSPPRITELVQIVSAYYGVCYDDVTGHRKTPPILMRARRVAMFMAVDFYCGRKRSSYDLGYSAVARVIGKDHTSILHAVNKIKEDLAGPGEYIVD